MLRGGTEFQYFHTYRQLAQDGLVPSLTCPCGMDYVTLSRDGVLVLWCPVDDRDTIPGERMRYHVEKAVDRLRGEIE